MLRYRAKTDAYRKSFDWLTERAELASVRIQLPLFVVSSFYVDFILLFFFFALQTWNSILSKANHQHFPPTAFNPNTHNTFQMAKGAEGFSDGTYPVFPSQRSIKPRLAATRDVLPSEWLRALQDGCCGKVGSFMLLRLASHICHGPTFGKDGDLECHICHIITFTKSNIILSRPPRHQ